jgi:hypothetical protein
MRESLARPREFKDAAGIRWRVREAEPAGHPRALYFETDNGFRRVTAYPPNWRDLPTSELEILSLRT